MSLNNICVIQDRIPQNEKMWAIADACGCKLAVKENGKYNEVYGLVGNTFPIKDKLKSAGFRFDGAKRAWFADQLTFESLRS